MPNHVMMKCGHAANATHNGKPSCVICAGIHPGAEVVDDSPPSLEGRTARCSCGKERPSDQALPFFERGGVRVSSPLFHIEKEAREKVIAYRKGRKEPYDVLAKTEPAFVELVAALKQAMDETQRTATVDTYYCGCMGWD